MNRASLLCLKFVGSYIISIIMIYVPTMLQLHHPKSHLAGENPEVQRVSVKYKRLYSMYTARIYQIPPHIKPTFIPEWGSWSFPVRPSRTSSWARDTEQTASMSANDRGWAVVWSCLPTRADLWGPRKERENIRGVSRGRVCVLGAQGGDEGGRNFRWPKETRNRPWLANYLTTWTGWCQPAEKGFPGHSREQIISLDGSKDVHEAGITQRGTGWRLQPGLARFQQL